MFLRRAAKLYPNKVGVVCGDSRWTYRTLHSRTQRLSYVLQHFGIKSQDVVAYLGPNCHRLLECYYGVPQAGAILLALNIRLSSQEILGILNHSGARILLLEREFSDMIDPIRHQFERPMIIVCLDEPSSHSWIHGQSYDELLSAMPDSSFPDRIASEDAIAELFYTSGTTATPKGVMLSHRNLYLHATNIMWVLGNHDREVQLHTIALFHANGWGAAHTITAVGGTHVMLRKFDPKKLLQLVQEERVTTFNLVPTMATLLLKESSIRDYDLRSLRLIHMGGSAVPKEMIQALHRRFECEVFAGYGLTETCPVLTVSLHKSHLHEDLETAMYRAAMTGLELPGTEVRVVDESGEDVPADGRTIGEIIARGNTIMEGYWNEPEETSKAIRNGWLYTGDLATIDAEGYILIVDRKKDLIIRGGENISSIEVERALYTHPDVLECAVIAVPDDKWGEEPMAFVVLKDGTSSSPEELRQHCRKLLAGYKVPASLEIVSTLPKGGTGKIQKRLLRAPYWKAEDKQVH